MTRGTLVLLNPEKMIVAQEINGDMFLHFKGQTDENGELYERTSRGAEAYQKLKKVNTKKDLKELLDELYFDQFTPEEKGALVSEVNDSEIIKEMLSFNHCGDKVEVEREDGTTYDASWYFYNWFSDYVFIKNNTGEKLQLIDRDHQIKQIADQEVVVLRFGRFYNV